MSTVVDIFVSILVLFVFAWVAIFGGIGALLARSREGSGVAGLTWGVLLGPIGWVGIWWTTRSGAPPDAPQGEPQSAYRDDDWADALVAVNGGSDG